MKRKAHLHGGCEAAPGTHAAREIDKAWREGRVIPMNAAAFRNASTIYAGLGIDINALPTGLRPGTKVGKRK
jgi:hypothetical protein